MQADGVLRPPWEAWPRRWLARSLTEGEQDPAELCRHEFAWAHACAHRPWGPWPGRLARDAAWPAGCLLSRAFGPNVGGLRHLRPLTPGRSRPGPDRRPENADGHAFCPWLCVALSSDSAPLAFSSRPAPLLPSTASPSAINGKSVNCERPLQGHAPISSGPRAAVGNRAQPLSVCLSGLVPLHTLSGGGGRAGGLVWLCEQFESQVLSRSRRLFPGRGREGALFLAAPLLRGAANGAVCRQHVGCSVVCLPGDGLGDPLPWGRMLCSLSDKKPPPSLVLVGLGCSQQEGGGR